MCFNFISFPWQVFSTIWVQQVYYEKIKGHMQSVHHKHLCMHHKVNPSKYLLQFTAKQLKFTPPQTHWCPADTIVSFLMWNDSKSLRATVFLLHPSTFNPENKGTQPHTAQCTRTTLPFELRVCGSESHLVKKSFFPRISLFRSISLFPSLCTRSLTYQSYWILCQTIRCTCPGSEEDEEESMCHFMMMMSICNYWP